MSSKISLFLKIFLSLFLYIPIHGNATIISSQQNGNWDDATSWDLGRAPSISDTIYIGPGDTIVINSNLSLSGAPTFIVVDGVIHFDGGGSKITLDLGSTFAINENGYLLTSGTGGGSSETIVIDGTTEWRKDDGDVPGPAYFGTPISFNPMPVELVAFTTKVKEGNVDLKWTVESQTLNDYFSISRSVDGESFELIKTVPGDGTLNKIKSFTYEDIEPGFGTFYYKLAQTDFNGDYEELAVAAVQIERIEKQNIYPNPVIDKFYLDIQLTQTDFYSFEIISITGKLVYSETFQLSKGLNHIELKRPHSSAGIYLLQVSNPTNTLLVEKLSLK